ncbi:hypothetical protein NliqN6_1492 [Naganishia liquefaciens]|uniref:Glycerophosphocholine acyltransferase 1 n=1 Tax=Naganishia liquefaciens TaxID=104408 RepID=A0A8H3YD70_9TREE|nr:hypothetical protein NliqN6_1492 [Naganishia liquefaciens]
MSQPEADISSSSRPGLSRSSSSRGSIYGGSTGTLRSGNARGYEADEENNWAGALTLLDVFETYFDSRLDLLERQFRVSSRKVKQAASELIPKGLRTPRTPGAQTPLPLEGEDVDDAEKRAKWRSRYKKDVEKEVDRIRQKLAAKVNDLSTSWHSAQIVRTRDKVSFLFSVLSLTFTCLIVGNCPEWMPLAYTVQSAVYLPTRIWSYKRKAYHYFLFGPIASAIITWRNSLVFHSIDKVTSLFIHMYPPLVLIIVKHFYRGREERYPAVMKTSEFTWANMILFSVVPYVIWQGLYWKFVIHDRREKIESGQRQTSFRYMLNDKHGPIGKALKGIPPAYREASFMGGQLVYSIICMLPAATFLNYSPKACIVFLILVWSQAVWNGASFYVEVFGRKFERELEKLRKEINTTSSTPNSVGMPSQPSSPLQKPSDAASSTPQSHETQLNTLANAGLRPALGLSNSPLALGPTSTEAETGERLHLGESAASTMDIAESRKDR